MFKFNYHDSIWTEREQRNQDRKPVTTFRLDSTGLEKWMTQNGASYSGEFVEGCLLDNFVVCTRRGFAAIYENYVNTWTSDYYVEFQPGAAQDVFAAWYDFEEDMLARA